MRGRAKREEEGETRLRRDAVWSAGRERGQGGREKTALSRCSAVGGEGGRGGRGLLYDALLTRSASHPSASIYLRGMCTLCPHLQVLTPSLTTGWAWATAHLISTPFPHIQAPTPLLMTGWAASTYLSRATARQSSS